MQSYIKEKSAICQPDAIHICDGSESENNMLLEEMVQSGEIKKLPKYENWYEQSHPARFVKNIHGSLIT